MRPAKSDAVYDIELKLLLEAIHLRYHYDFRQYATASLKRRLAQALARFQCDSLSAFQGRVLRDPEVFHELISYFTVQVSDMFRDPPFYLALRREVVPFLRTYPSLKIWIPGVSSGEEAYSIAILLLEEGLLERSIIYATDINPEALRKAAAGVYSLERAAQFSEAYRAAGGLGSLSDYYTAGYGSVVFDRALRKNTVFSDHSLATDTVFAEVELVSCRNVLIYFDRVLQDRAIGLFRDSLSHGGFLGLGAKETLRFSRYKDDFSEFVGAQKIFRRR